MSNHGSVPELKVVNKSPRMILILDGEELVGAKQNRIVNTTILVQGNATIVIPVSCVEHGRWSYDSPKFHSQERMMSSNLRAMKSEQVSYSIRSSGEYRSDQGAIWDGIAEKAERMGAPSPTGAMAEIYDKERPTIEEYVKPFHLIDSQVGAIFMINGKVAGLDAFGKPGTFSEVFKNSLKAMLWMPSIGMTRKRNPKPLKARSPNSRRQPLRPTLKAVHPWVWERTSAWNPRR